MSLPYLKDKTPVALCGKALRSSLLLLSGACAADVVDSLTHTHFFPTALWLFLCCSFILSQNALFPAPKILRYTLRPCSCFLLLSVSLHTSPPYLHHDLPLPLPLSEVSGFESPLYFIYTSITTLTASHGV